MKPPSVLFLLSPSSIPSLSLLALSGVADASSIVAVENLQTPEVVAYNGVQDQMVQPYETPRSMQGIGLGDWESCNSSADCTNGCCSSKYSYGGQLQCTPIGGFVSDICVTLSFGTSTTTSPVGTCGDGYRGNGICLDGSCCSEHGWCGTTVDHCTGSDAAQGPALLRNGTCGDGDRGDGICPDGTCCSEFGWCGSTPEHCAVADPTAAPSAATPEHGDKPIKPTNATLLGDWQSCTSNSQCMSECCSLVLFHEVPVYQCGRYNCLQNMEAPLTVPPLSSPSDSPTSSSNTSQRKTRLILGIIFGLVIPVIALEIFILMRRQPNDCDPESDAGELSPTDCPEEHRQASYRRQQIMWDTEDPSITDQSLYTSPSIGRNSNHFSLRSAEPNFMSRVFLGPPSLLSRTSSYADNISVFESHSASERSSNFSNERNASNADMDEIAF